MQMSPIVYTVSARSGAEVAAAIQRTHAHTEQ